MPLEGYDNTIEDVALECLLGQESSCSLSLMRVDISSTWIFILSERKTQQAKVLQLFLGFSAGTAVMNGE